MNKDQAKDIVIEAWENVPDTFNSLKG